MSKTQWFKGPPPSIGWWPARLTKRCAPNLAVRWWDGKSWGAACYPCDGPGEAAYWSKKKSDFQCEILWAKRPKNWPARSYT